MSWNLTWGSFRACSLGNMLFSIEKIFLSTFQRDYSPRHFFFNKWYLSNKEKEVYANVDLVLPIWIENVLSWSTNETWSFWIFYIFSKCYLWKSKRISQNYAIWNRIQLMDDNVDFFLFKIGYLLRHPDMLLWPPF